MVRKEVKQIGKAEWKKFSEHYKAVQELFHTRAHHALNINLCV